MSNRRKKDDKDKEPNSTLETVLGTGAAVIGAAAIAYGAIKLFEFFANNSEEGASAAPTASTTRSAKPPKKVCDSSDDDGGYNVPVPSRRNYGLPERNDSTTTRPRFATANPETSLSTQLLDYYKNYVDMNPMDFRDAAKVVKDLKMEIARCMQRNMKLKALGVYGTLDTGSSTDGLMVVRPESFDILIPFELSPHENVINQTDAASELHSIGLEHVDKAWSVVCNRRNCLDSTKFINLLSDVLDEAVCSGSSVVTSAKKLKFEEATAVVEVRYANGLKKVAVNIIPAVVIGDRRFVPEHAPPDSSPGNGEEQEDFCWRESFTSREQEILNRFGARISSHKIILKIFKAIRLNFPLQFGLLSSYHYKTILLHVLDDQMDAADWDTSALPERFIDFLIELGNCLKERKLAHYFRPECNLLDVITPESSQNLAHYVNKIVGHHDIASLLKYDYGN